MIYKTTYKFCTLILLAGISLFAAKDNLVSSNQSAQIEDTIHLLEHSNKLLSKEMGIKVDDVVYSVRRYRHYKELAPFAKSVHESVEQFIASMDSIGMEIKSSNKLVIHKAKQYHNNILTINNKADFFVDQMLTVLSTLEKERRFGIRPDEIKELKEELSKSDFGGIKLFEISTTESLHLELTKLKHQSLIKGNAICKYIRSRIGGGCFEYNRISAVSVPEQLIVKKGKQFKTDIEYATLGREIVSVKVDGNTIERYKGEYTYCNVSQEIGKKDYTVEMEIYDKLTRRVYHRKQTFSYTVE